MSERIIEKSRNGELPVQFIEYRGNVFKSRTEVQWAFIYGQLGVRFQYEPVQYSFDHGKKYTPDFYLPDFNCFVEIKRDNLGMIATHKAVDLSLTTGLPVYIFDGIQMNKWQQNNSESAVLIDQDRISFQHRWCECYRCRKLSIEPHGDERLIKCGCTKNLDKRKQPNQERIHNAFNAAISDIQFVDLGQGRMGAITSEGKGSR